MQRLFARLVALQQAAASGLAHPVMEQPDHGLNQIGNPDVNARREHVQPPKRVGDQEDDLLDGNLGGDPNCEVRQAHDAHQ